MSTNGAEMSEDDVNKMVQDALRRARRAMDTSADSTVSAVSGSSNNAPASDNSLAPQSKNDTEVSDGYGSSPFSRSAEHNWNGDKNGSPADDDDELVRQVEAEIANATEAANRANRHLNEALTLQPNGVVWEMKGASSKTTSSKVSSPDDDANALLTEFMSGTRPSTQLESHNGGVVADNIDRSDAGRVHKPKASSVETDEKKVSSSALHTTVKGDAEGDTQQEEDIVERGMILDVTFEGEEDDNEETCKEKKTELWDEFGDAQDSFNDEFHERANDSFSEQTEETVSNSRSHFIEESISDQDPPANNPVNDRRSSFNEDGSSVGKQKDLVIEENTYRGIKNSEGKVTIGRKPLPDVGMSWWNNENILEGGDSDSQSDDEEEDIDNNNPGPFAAPDNGNHWWNNDDDSQGSGDKENNRELRNDVPVGIESESYTTTPTVHDTLAETTNPSLQSSQVDSLPQTKVMESSMLPRNLAESRVPMMERAVEVPPEENEAELNVSTESGPGTRRIKFRNPYPIPPPITRPRDPAEILKDHEKPPPKANTNWLDPKESLDALLRAAKGTSVARRSNACGALKVLASKKKNTPALARTSGVLDALIFAASQIPPSRDDTVALDARTRAVTTILSLAELKENRILVFMHPNLPETLVKVIREDTGEARVHACMALAVLAKTPDVREKMVEIKGLVATLGKVVGGKGDDGNIDISDKDSFAPNLDSESSDDGSTDGSESSSDDDEMGPMGKNLKHMHVRSSTVPTSARGGKKKNKNPRHNSLRQQKDEMYDEFLALSRRNACAALIHLSKHCTVSASLCKNNTLLENIVMVSLEFENPIHTRCIEILCHLTRSPSNNESLARNSELVETLIKCGKSKVPEDRMWAIRTLQNLTADAFSKITLATGPLLTLLTVSAMRKEYDEQSAAVGALLNLSTEPGAIVPLTNTKNVVATLVHLAHSSASSSDVRRMACDALATIGLWLQTLAGAGVVPEEVTPVPLPSHSASGWLRWE